MDEDRYVAVSRTAERRPVFVAYCWRGDRLRPISARYMHKREADRYDLTTQDRSPDDQ